MGRQAKNGAAAREPLSPEEKAAAKRERFLRLAPKRVIKAIKALDTLSRLANRNAYTFKDEEAAKICQAVSEMAEATVNEFTRPQSKAALFSL